MSSRLAAVLLLLVLVFSSVADVATGADLGLASPTNCNDAISSAVASVLTSVSAAVSVSASASAYPPCVVVGESDWTRPKVPAHGGEAECSKVHRSRGALAEITTNYVMLVALIYVNVVDARGSNVYIKLALFVLAIAGFVTSVTFGTLALGCGDAPPKSSQIAVFALRSLQYPAAACGWAFYKVMKQREKDAAAAKKSEEEERGQAGQMERGAAASRVEERNEQEVVEPMANEAEQTDGVAPAVLTGPSAAATTSALELLSRGSARNRSDHSAASNPS